MLDIPGDGAWRGDRLLPSPFPPPYGFEVDHLVPVSMLGRPRHVLRHLREHPLEVAEGVQAVLMAVWTIEYRSAEALVPAMVSQQTRFYRPIVKGLMDLSARMLSSSQKRDNDNHFRKRYGDSHGTLPSGARRHHGPRHDAHVLQGVPDNA